MAGQHGGSQQQFGYMQPMQMYQNRMYQNRNPYQQQQQNPAQYQPQTPYQNNPRAFSMTQFGPGASFAAQNQQAQPPAAQPAANTAIPQPANPVAQPANPIAQPAAPDPVNNPAQAPAASPQAFSMTQFAPGASFSKSGAPAGGK